MDEGAVEAGGLRVQGQHQLLLLEQRLGVGLGVGLPLRQRDDAAPAQRVAPGFGGRNGEIGESGGMWGEKRGDWGKAGVGGRNGGLG